MKIKKLTDEQCLSLFQELIATRVKLGTVYLAEGATGLMTHQMLTVEVGDLRVTSSPEPLTYPMLPVLDGDMAKERTVH